MARIYILFSAFGHYFQFPMLTTIVVIYTMYASIYSTLICYELYPSLFLLQFDPYEVPFKAPSCTDLNKIFAQLSNVKVSPTAVE